MRKLFTAVVAVSLAATAMAQSRTFTANPPSGSTVKEITSFTLTSNDPDYPNLEVISGDEITVTRNDVVDCGGIKYNNYSDPISITLKTPQTEPGTYVIKIPRGSIQFATSDWGEYVDGIDTNIVYVIEGDTPQPAALPVQVMPASGSTLAELSTITIAAPEGVDYIELIDSSEITMTKDGQPYTGFTIRSSSLNYVVTLSPAATEPGTYKLIVPAGAFEDSNMSPIPAFEVTYTVGGEAPVSSVVTADPASGSTVTELNAIVIKSATDQDLYDIISSSMISVKKDGADFCDVRVKDNYDGSFTLTLATKATEAGKYKVAVEEGAFEYESGAAVPAFELDYTIEGTVAPVTYKVNADPASGSTLTEPLTSVTITSGETDYPYLDITSQSKITVTRDGQPFGGVKATASRDGYVLTLTEKVTESGEYVIHLPQDSWEIFQTTDETYEAQSFDLDLTYTVELPGAKYTIEILPGRVTPNSEDGEDVDLSNYDGKQTDIRVKVNGQLYLNKDAEATVASLVCKKNKYDVSKALRADEPKQSFGSWSTTFYLDLDPAVVQNGTYTFSIPRGAFGDAEFAADPMTGTANKAFSLDITFIGGEPAPEPSVVYDLGIKGTNPAEGEVDMDGRVWEVTQIRVEADYNVRPGSMVTLANEATGFSATAELREGFAMGNTRTMLFTNGKEPNANGTYILTIPQGSFGDAEWLADPETGHANAEIKVYYRVFGASDTEAAYDLQVASTTPANEATADIESEPLAISFTAPGELGFYPNSQLTVVCEGAEYDNVAVITGAQTADGFTTFTTTLAEPVLVNGTYTVTIPKGVFGDLEYVADCSKGHGNEAFTFTFTVTGGQGQKEPIVYDLIPEVTPASDTTVLPGQLDRIVFVFPQGTRTTSDTARASMRCSEANYFDTAYFIKGENDGTFVLNFGSKLSRDGVYTLTLPQGTFADAADAHENPEIVYTYTFQTSGIDSILTDEEAAAGVYTLTGVYVGDTTENLPAGIYVVKGRKIIKK